MFVCTILLLLFQDLNAVFVSLNETEYARMPPVLKMDSYESCIHQPGGLYCDIVLTLVSDTPSQLLTMIQEYSAYTATHYNHTKMHYSVCVTKTCSNFYKNTTVDLKSSLETCLNYTLWQDYQLKARVSDGYSCNIHEKHLHIGVGDIIVAGICLTILVVNLIGSLWDFFCATEVKSKVVQSLLCFSISRNWRKLTAAGGSTGLHTNQFQCLHGIRLLITCSVIGTHSFIPLILIGENTRFTEELYNNPVMQMFSTGTLFMQVFFMISAMFLVYNSQLYAETHNISWTMVPKLILMRWWRLTPPYAVVLGLTATWLRFVTTGPRWQMAVGDEAQDCRQYWWQHILYVNNYNDNTQCMPHTWYLAADTQLACLGVLVYVICRSSAIKKVVLSLLLIAAIMGPALHTYYQDLEAIVIFSPETAINFSKDNPTYDNVYKRGHTNLAGSVFGLSMGYLIYHWRASGFDPEKYKKYRYLCWVALPLTMCVVYSGTVFFNTQTRYPPLLRAVYAGLSRPVLATCAAAVLLGMIMKVEGVYRGIFGWRGWAAPSRLSYCVYLCHVAYIRYASASLYTTMHVTILRWVEISLITTVVSFAAALVLWLLVEAPGANLMKLVTTRNPKTSKTDLELEKGTDDVVKL